MDVHASPQALEGYLVVDDAGEVKDFKWGPEIDDVKAELTIAPRVMILGFMAIDKLFTLDLFPELSRLDRALRALENPLEP